ncbi:type IX secretion system protein PorQ [uncultured Sunxiuqinia sp.]|uniref:type IX secretion system protein PorQ n=1 Tax=uncultured Sunxiuqinia sp. TaxID=1573825 RepID=UPI00262282D2|nr:type IX secretion system protein PorQ [uncultured Sunxiuqinia sp.]
MKTKQLILLALIFATLQVRAQIGGENTYEFLNLPNSARMAALGGNQIAINDSTDLNVAYNNPSLLHAEMDNKLLLNYINYFDDIQFGYASYAKNYGQAGVFALGMHYINYGKFVYADEFGERGGTFKAAEYALNILWSKSFNRLRVGATLKPILSSFEAYQSFGVAIDLGVSYASPNRLSNVALVFRNIGSQVTTYYDGAERESIPFDIQLGFSKRLEHAPLRLSATLQHLQKWELAQPKENDNGFESTIQKDSFGKQFMRHLLLGIELLPTENLTLRAGYNYQRRQELIFNDKASTVGFSWGFGFKINRFHFNYGSARYHLAASSNHISVAINLNENFH